MSQVNKPNNQEAPGFFDKPENVRWILIVFYILSGLLFALDFVVHRHIYLDFEKIPAFYALYGFVACVVLVVIAKWMRVLLMRKEDYYDPIEDDSLEKGGDKHVD